MSDLAKLATRIRDDLIEQVQGEDYAAHHVINQLLLLAVGPFSFERVEIIRGDVLSRDRGQGKPSFSDAHSTVILRNVVVGATCRLTCVVDGRREVIEQTGDVEHPENWQHDGARLKDAESDALKRCAMRFGLGLHLWSQELYRLDAWLSKQALTAEGAKTSPGPGVTVQDAAAGNSAGKPVDGDGGRSASPAASHPAGPGDPTVNGAGSGGSRPVDATVGATVADLKALCDRKGTHVGMLLAAVRKAAKNGEGTFPRAWGYDGRRGLQSFDQLAPDALGKVLAWADPDAAERADRALGDALAADTPDGETS